MEAQPYQVPPSSLMPEVVYCRYCAEQIGILEQNCHKCGASQNLNSKSKTVAAVLALFLGSFGMHRFYLGQWWGLFYLLFYWTGIPALAGLIEALVFVFTSQTNWDLKYGNAKRGSMALAVVGILVGIMAMGIVAAIALPAYKDYQTRSQQRAQQIEQGQ